MKFFNSNTTTLKPINIVVVGESGAGKSTWINAFANLVSYELLEDAEKGKLITLIPSEFTLCDENFTQVKIRTGRHSRNENFSAGQSATQNCKAYTFKIGDYLIRLIDTPGIGDTRGIVQDSNNLRNIIRTLANFEEIHGICVLLKPNNARLNFMFRFCINELFTCLHQRASKNLLFCFTNTRGTFYRPGESITALRELIKENKSIGTLSRNQIYCFDSEAYRYLAAVKNATPMKFSSEDRAHFEVSWNKSMLETKRMLRNILSLEPHTFKYTLEVNRLDCVFEKIVSKFMQINRNVKSNTSIIQDKQREIEDIDAKRKELKIKLMTCKTVIESRRLPFPRLVCSNSKCVRVWSQNNKQYSEYFNICHSKCTSYNARENVVGDPNLMHCSRFRNGICSHHRCGHSYREHLQIRIDHKPTVKIVEDFQVAQKLRKIKIYM